MQDAVPCTATAARSVASRCPVDPDADPRPDDALLIGRSDLVARLREGVAAGTPLITVVGAPGIGKTRLVEAALADLPGALFCEVDDVTEPAELLARLGNLLRIAIVGVDQDHDLARLAGALAEHWADLAIPGSGAGGAIVCDGFDGLVVAAAKLIADLGSRGGVPTIVITSRQRLGIAIETTLQVDPLSLPSDDGDTSAAPGATVNPDRVEIGGGEPSESVQLFLARARRARPGYQPAAEEWEAIGRLVELLGGVPLAIEVAAARMDVVGACQLVALLEDGLAPELVGQSSGSDSGVFAAVHSSWASLSDDEQRVLACCSVFEGGFDLEGARAVFGASSKAVALDLLQRLRAKSLVTSKVVSGLGGELRFALLWPIASYSQQRLEERGEKTAVCARHADHYAAFGLRQAEEALGPHGPRALSRLRLDAENLKAVVDRALALKDGELVTCGLKAALALSTLWTSGPNLPMVPRVEALCALASASDVALRDAVVLGWTPALQRVGRASTTQVASIVQRAVGRDDERQQGWSLRTLAELHYALGEIEASWGAAAKAVAILKAPGDVQRARALVTLARATSAGGSPDTARMLLEEALVIDQRVGSIWHEAVTCGELGILDLDAGHANHAIERFERACSIHRAIGSDLLAEFMAASIGVAQHDLGELDLAVSQHRRAIATMRRLGDRPLEAYYRGFLAAALLAGDARSQARQELEAALAALNATIHGTYDAFLRGLSVIAEGGERRFDLAERHLTFFRDGQQVLSPADLALGKVVEASFALQKRAQQDSPTSREIADTRAILRDAQAATSVELRIFLDLIAAELARSDSAPLRKMGIDMGAALRSRRVGGDQAPRLVVSVTDNWIRMPTGQRIDLASRPALFGMLRLLVETHRATDGTSLQISQLTAAGWPGERMMERAARNRVYVAISTLKKLGLGPFIERDDGGYRLRSGISICHADS